MTEQERNILLVDLCARLPYGVKIDREWVAPMTGSPEHSIHEFDTFDIEILTSWLDEEGGGLVTCDDGRLHWVRKYSCKPYLRSILSITKEERRELLHFGGLSISESEEILDVSCVGFERHCKVQDWLNAHHFDYRGLIEKGLALEAPEGMYEIKN